jgi:hypothetical protein
MFAGFRALESRDSIAGFSPTLGWMEQGKRQEKKIGSSGGGP